MASLLYRFLYWWSGHLPLRLISKAGGPYLERYYLFTLFGHRFYLHRFVASDPDGWHAGGGKTCDRRRWPRLPGPRGV